MSSTIPAGIYHYLVRKNCYEGVKNSDPSSKHGKNLCPVGKGPASKTGHWNEVIVWYGRTALDEKKKQTMSSVSHAAATLHSEEAVDVLVVSSDMEVRDWTLRNSPSKTHPSDSIDHVIGEEETPISQLTQRTQLTHLTEQCMIYGTPGYRQIGEAVSRWATRRRQRVAATNTTTEREEKVIFEPSFSCCCYTAH